MRTCFKDFAVMEFDDDTGHALVCNLELEFAKLATCLASIRKGNSLEHGLMRRWVIDGTYEFLCLFPGTG